MWRFRSKTIYPKTQKRSPNPRFWGLSRFQYAGLSFSVAKGPFDTMGHFLLVTQGRPLVFNFLQMPARKLEPEAWVPADVTGYYSLTWDDTFLGNFLVGLGGAAFLPGLNDRLTIITDLTDSQGILIPRVLLAWEREKLPNGDAAIKKIQSLLLANAPIDGVKTEERIQPDGLKIYVRDYGQELQKMIGPGEPVPVGKVSMTATKTHLLLTTHEELLEKVLDYRGAGLSQNRDFQAVAKHFPKECSLIAYQAPRQHRLLFQALKSGKLAEVYRENSTSRLLDGLIEMLDGNLLPEYDSVEKFFTPSGGFAIMDDSGFRYTHFSLKAE